eukprot:5712988-Pyramimonas_sp.AAC.1
MVIRDSELTGVGSLPPNPYRPEMPRHLASRNTTARESQTYRRQPRTSTDPAPLCPIGSSTKTRPQRLGSLETVGQKYKN